MRVFSLVALVLALLAVPTAASAARLGAPGPNANWTEMQKFEWYVGYLAAAANLCRAYGPGNELQSLARMSPYGTIGLKSLGGADGFVGAVCGEITKDAEELASDAAKIRAYLETTYNCSGTDCYGKTLVDDWQSHSCGKVLAKHLSSFGIEVKDVSSVGFANVTHTNTDLNYQARVRLKSCQGSLYVKLDESCRIEEDFTRGDCTIEGIKGY